MRFHRSFFLLGGLFGAAVVFSALAAGCSQVQVVDGATASSGSTTSSAGGAGSGGSTTSSGSTVGAGGDGGAIEIPSMPWAIGVGSPDAEDYGTHVAVDAGGNVYVAGRVEGNLDFGNGVVLGYANNGDRFLVKISASGVPLWSRRVPAGVASIAVDSQGYLWTTGAIAQGTSEMLGDDLPSGFLSGYYLARYTPEGGFVWARSIAKDAIINPVLVPSTAGGVVLVGELFSSYDSITVGDVTLSPQPDIPDIFAVAVDSSGEGLWGRFLGADLWSKPKVSSYEALEAAPVPGGGLVVLSGVTIVKLDPAGKTLWSKHPTSPQMPGPFFVPSGGAAVAVDASGDVVIYDHPTSGPSLDFGGGPLAVPANLVIKLDSKGGHLWSRKLDADEFGYDALVGLGVAPGGVISLGVDGYFQGSPAALIRLSAAGDVLGLHPWTEAPGGDAAAIIHPMALAVDHAGNTLLTGAYTGAIDLGTGALPVALTANDSYTSNLFIAKIVP